MTIAGEADVRPAADTGARQDAAEGPAPGHRPDLESGRGPAPGTDQRRLNAPPFSWLGSDAWPSFPLWADKPS